MSRGAAFVALALLLAPDPGRAEIPVRGRVAAGGPVRDVRVALEPIAGRYESARRRLDGEPTAAVAESAPDADGFFELAAPEAGLWRVVVTAPGRRAAGLDLTPLVEPVDLPLVKLADLEVLAVGPEEDPVAAGGLHEERRDGWRPLPRGPLPRDPLPRGPLPRGVHPESGGRGEPRLPAGAVALVVTDPMGAPAPGAVVLHGTGLVPLGRTGGDGRVRLSLADGAAVRVLAGDGASAEAVVAGEETRVSLRRPHAVGGVVVEEGSGEPIAGAVLVAARREVAVSGPRGEFALDVPGIAVHRRGWFALEVAAAGYGRARRPLLADRGGLADLRIALPRTARTAGVVVDGSGRPVSGADVVALAAGAGRVRAAEAGPARSWRDGRFELRGLDPWARYEVVARKDGYAPASRVLDGLDPAAPPAGVRLVLAAGVTATGRVTGDDGVPVAAAEVALRRASEDAERRRRGQGAEATAATTDDDGRFTISHVAPASYDLEVRAPGFAAAEVPGLEIDLTNGEVDLGTVVLVPAVTLTGRVIDARGVPIAGAEIRTQRGEPHYSSFRPPRGPTLTTGADGVFELDGLGPDEQWALTVTGDGYAGRVVRVVTAYGAAPLEIELGPASRLGGRVIDAGERPVAGARVWAQPLRSDAAVAATARTGDDGRFRIEQAPAGPVQVSATADGYQSARLPAVEVPEGGEVDDLEIVLRAAVILTGRVTYPDGRPAAEVDVEVEWKPDERSSSSLGTATGFDGRYRITSLAPGRLTVSASRGGLQRSRPRTIDVEAGTYTVDLELGTGFEVTGRVFDATGAPVAGASLALHAAGAGTRAGGAMVRSTGDGAFAFEGVAPGLYVVEATKEGYATVRTSEPVAVDGDVRGVEIEMDRGATLRGRILGVELDDLAEISLRAFNHQGGSRRARVDYEGAYVVASLGRGTWTVVADAGGRRVQAQVEIAPGDVEVVRDLEFQPGFTLSGAVLESSPERPPRPAAGAFVTVRGDGGSAHARTDSAGRFRLAELPEGTYELRIAWSSVFHREEIELTADDELEIVVATSRIGGRVVAAGGPPLAGVSVGLAPIVERGDRHPPFVNLGYVPETDAEGRFRLSPLPLGRWRLTFSKPGFENVEIEVDLRSGVPAEGLVVEMVPSADRKSAMGRLLGETYEPAVHQPELARALTFSTQARASSPSYDKLARELERITTEARKRWA